MVTKVMGIRLGEKDKRILQREAKRNGMSLSEYVRSLARLKVDLKMTISDLRKTNDPA